MTLNQRHHEFLRIAEDIKGVIALNNVNLDFLEYKSKINNFATQEEVKTNPELLTPYQFNGHTILFLDEFTEFLELAYNTTEVVEELITGRIDEKTFTRKLKFLIREKE